MTHTTQPSSQPGSPLDFCPSRRAVLAALPGIALLPVVVACGGPSTDSGGDKGSGGAGAGPAKVPLSAVPAGNAVVIAGTGPKRYVVAQPTEGKFTAFDATCTHQGATVAVKDGLTLECPAHFSQFNAGTGAVEHSPATKPLTAVPVRLEGDTLLVG